MIKLNSKIKAYEEVKRQFVAEVFFCIAILAFVASLVTGYFFFTFLFLSIFLGIPLSIISLIYLNSINFILEENKITINYGIIAKHSNTIPYHNIQSIENKTSVSGQIFKVTVMSIWTASPNQIALHNERKLNGKLYLPTTKAIWLKNYIFSEKNESKFN